MFQCRTALSLRCVPYILLVKELLIGGYQAADKAFVQVFQHTSALVGLLPERRQFRFDLVAQRLKRNGSPRNLLLFYRL
jgi:hypothetical protein